MQHLFFNETLQNAPARIASAKTPTRLLLDKNEQPSDVEFSLKMKVLNQLLTADWNRYPTADTSDIEARVAEYCGLAAENIALSPGSAALITTLLNYFALNGKRIVIAQPTYTLFDYHCKTYNIAYESWYLTADLEYDYANLPELGAGSVLIVTSPNNPVGNTIDLAQLERILTENPESFVVLDAVYAEFAGLDLAPLVRKHPNLMVLRSFSKAFPIAGLRFGYLCAAPQTAAVIRKLMLQFSLNHLTQVFAREVLFSSEFQESSRQRVRALIQERERMFRWLQLRFETPVLQVFPSAGNFLLLRIANDAAYAKTLAEFERRGIKVLQTAPFPLLHNTLRVSIGSPEENDQVLHCLADCLGQREMYRQPHVLLEGRYSSVLELTRLGRGATN